MTDNPSPAHPRPPRRRLGRVLGTVGVVTLCGALAVFLYGGPWLGKEAPAQCRAASAALARLDPFIHGEVAAMNLTRPARLVPNLAFKTADGQDKTLADFKGHTVLLNLWATWCVPCRKEMPALDRLQAKLAGDDFQVVAVNIDTARLDRPKAFLQEIGVTSLPLYTDSSAAIFQVLRSQGQALGLPTTLLIDRNGCEIGNMAGPAEWDSADAKKLVEAAASKS
jgi:thiol-disulfide isomerase/thioredoxin